MKHIPLTLLLAAPLLAQEAPQPVKTFETRLEEAAKSESALEKLRAEKKQLIEQQRQQLAKIDEKIASTENELGRFEEEAEAVRSKASAWYGDNAKQANDRIAEQAKKISRELEELQKQVNQIRDRRVAAVKKQLKDNGDFHPEDTDKAVATFQAAAEAAFRETAEEIAGKKR